MLVAVPKKAEIHVGFYGRSLDRECGYEAFESTAAVETCDSVSFAVRFRLVRLSEASESSSG